MKLSHLASLVFMYGLLAVIASARLGDTEAELVERFGKPTMHSKHFIFAQGKQREMGPTLHFRLDEWSISCDLVDGRCMRIGYAKPGGWTEDQIRLVLSTNSQGAAWTETSKPMIAKLQRSWHRSDGSMANWNLGQGMNLVWNAYNVAKVKLEEQAKVEGMKKPKIYRREFYSIRDLGIIAGIFCALDPLQRAFVSKGRNRSWPSIEADSFR
jgi:hypothetical protein